MFEEDFPIPGAKTNTERVLHGLIMAQVIFLSWCLAGHSLWALILATALSLAGPVIVLRHWQHGYFSDDRRPLLYLLLMVPGWVTAGVFVAGLFNPGIEEVTLGGEAFLTLSHAGPLLPSVAHWQAGWPRAAFSVLTLALVVPVVFLVDSRWVVHRMLLVLGLNAALLALAGYFLLLSGNAGLWGLLADGGAEAFSVFPRREQWSFFALIWLAVLLGLTCYDKFTLRWKHFLRGSGTFKIAGVALLAGSVYVYGSPWSVGAATVLITIALCYLAYDHFGVARKSAWRWPVAVLLGAGAVGTAVLGGQSALERIVTPAPEPALLVDASQPRGASQRLDLKVIEGPRRAEAGFAKALEIHEARPLFGWGAGSYPRVNAFFQPVDLRSPHTAQADSSLGRALVEIGVVGIGAWLFLAVCLLVLLAGTKEKLRWLTTFLGLGLALAAGAALQEASFAAPVNFVSFWVVAFLAVRWTTIPTVLSTDKRTRIVFTEEEMRKAPDERAPPETPAPATSRGS